MGTLDELIHYCNTEEPMGAMFLLGDSGCGKTYLVDKELKEALKDTHVIVRVSLFGISGFEDLHEAVKQKWFSALLPVYSNLGSSDEQMVIGKSFMKAANAVLKAVFPKVSFIGDAANNLLNDVTVLPVVEDIHSKKKKRVVLVFDDVDCTKLEPLELLGIINDYCENRDFHTIVIGNRENVMELGSRNDVLYRTAKEKSIAYMVTIRPDYAKVISSLIAEKNWRSEEYAAFLKEHEETIIDVFASGNADGADEGARGKDRAADESSAAGNGAPGGGNAGAGAARAEAGAADADRERAHESRSETGADEDASLGRQHNVRSLSTALEGFFRVHHHLTQAGITNLEPYLRSFLAFYLAERSGIVRDGKTSYTFTDEDLAGIYPGFSPAYLFDSVRSWIRDGCWDSARFAEELKRAKEAGR